MFGALRLRRAGCFGGISIQGSLAMKVFSKYKIYLIKAAMLSVS